MDYLIRAEMKLLHGSWYPFTSTIGSPMGIPSEAIARALLSADYPDAEFRNIEVVDRTALSFWFPRLQASGLPVPKTHLLKMSDEAQRSVYEVLDGGEPSEALQTFCAEVAEAIPGVGGYPAFLRTDHTSGKHEWKRSCFIANESGILTGVMGVIEYSMLAGMMGLPWSRWAVREYLPVHPVAYCPAFGDMPVVKEFRFFVEDDHVKCWHPYWGQRALDQGDVQWFAGRDIAQLHALDDKSLGQLSDLASAAGKACGGAWSVDILQVGSGQWFITDMAEADVSYHDPECPLCPPEQRRQELADRELDLFDPAEVDA